MRVLERFKKRFSSIFNLLQKLHDWFSPINRYEEQLNTLLAPRDECKYLYSLLTHGKSAAILLQKFQQMAIDEQLSNDQRGKANLLLSHLYKEDIEVGGFFLSKNENQAAEYQSRAIKLLGLNPTPSPTLLKFVEIIRLGGEPQYAIKTLQESAKNPQSNLFIWSNKILSYVYCDGISRKNFSVFPNQEIAKNHRQIAKKGLAIFDNKLKQLTKKISGSWFFKEKAFSLVKRITETDHQYAQYRYARFLEQLKGRPQKFIFYYDQAAKKIKETPLSFKKKGNAKAKTYLMESIENGRNGFEQNHEQSSHYRFQLALDKKNPTHHKSAQEILLKAKKGDIAAQLQIGLCHLAEKKPDIQEAEKIFKSVLPSQYTLLSCYEQTLFEKFCYKLGQYFENSFLRDPSSLTFELSSVARDLVSKAILYYQYLPKAAEKYSEIQYRIGHYQKFFLKDVQQAVKTFKNLGLQGDMQSAYSTILFGFNDYWNRYQKTLSLQEKEIISQFEQGNKSFFDQVKAVPISDIPDEISILLANLIQELDAYAKIKESDKTSLIAISEKIKNIKQIIEKEDHCDQEESLTVKVKQLFDSVGRFDPLLKMKFEHLWASRDKQKMPTASFFSSQRTTSGDILPYKMILGVLLNFLGLIKQQLELGVANAYFQLVEKLYLDYLSTFCAEIFSFHHTNTQEIGTNSCSTNQGMMVCKIN